MFGYFVLENEMFATPRGETHERVGVAVGVRGPRSAMTTSAQPASSAARQQSKAIRSKRPTVVHGADGSTVEHVTTPPKWTAADLPALTGRRFVITGASSGIGLAAAKALAATGASVVLAVRDPAKGERAASEIAGDTEVRRLDLADLASSAPSRTTCKPSTC
jgi:NADPH:quinone reductase-like Zn-dependent oxidoreductase